MKKMKKTFKSHIYFWLSLLLLIIILQFFYIFYQNKNLSSNDLILSSKLAIPTPIPNNVVNMDSLGTMTHWQKGVVYNVKATSEYRGRIIKIDDEGGKVEEFGWNPFNYALKITIEGEKGHWNDIYLNKQELLKTSFIEKSQEGKETLITYKDLRISNKVQAFLTIDLTKTFEKNFVSAKIIRINI